MKAIIAMLVIYAALATTKAGASCQILNSKGTVVEGLGDSLSSTFISLQKCPQKVQELRIVLKSQGYELRPAMVANRGIHNSKLGSFSFFEEVVGNELTEGQFFFGHFTGNKRGVIELEQDPENGNLLIELIAWDFNKQYYNFFELIGQGGKAQWFYRGDSADILLDNEMLFRNKTGTPPKFGTRLRCSACHTSGGPIMKELALPHNDWWTSSRPLEFGALKLSKEVDETVRSISPAEKFSNSVKKGIIQLHSSAKFQNIKQQKSRQEKLRPLFCDPEINLESDVSFLKNSGISSIQIPSGFLINPMLAKVEVEFSKQDYQFMLERSGMKFPETNEVDADHAWLTPVNGFSNIIEVEALRSDAQYGEDFVESVLLVDAENPLFSQTRCVLLKLVPEGGIANEWKANFQKKLEASSVQGARELLANWDFSPTERKNKIQEMANKAKSATSISTLFEKLIQKRAEVFSSDISKNPMGQILEPGFRVIFPKPSN